VATQNTANVNANTWFSRLWII